MRVCPECFEEFTPRKKGQLRCDACMQQNPIKHRDKPKKRKICSAPGCYNYATLSMDTPYCRSCFLSEKTIGRDIRKIKRLMNAKED